MSLNLTYKMETVSQERIYCSEKVKLCIKLENIPTVTISWLVFSGELINSEERAEHE